MRDARVQTEARVGPEARVLPVERVLPATKVPCLMMMMQRCQALLDASITPVLHLGGGSIPRVVGTSRKVVEGHLALSLPGWAGCACVRSIGEDSDFLS